MKYLYISISICIVLLFACTNKEIQPDNVIKTNLSESKISVNGIFRNAEIIPTETNDSILIKRITRFRLNNGFYYILDDSQGILFIFNSKGKCISRIAKKGQGPEEYTEVSDFTIDSSSNTIAMLGLYGNIYFYDLKANFIKKINLPKNLNVYYSIENYDKSNFVLFSFPVPREDAITVVSKADGAKFKGFWKHNDNTIKNSEGTKPFYTFNNKVYFSLIFSEKVFDLMFEELKVAYRWDFGKYGIDFDENRFETGKVNENLHVVSEALKNGYIPFFIMQENQNIKYYYAQLNVKYEKKMNLFHNKETKEELYFEKTQEGFTINPLLMNDEYLISELKYEEKDLFLNSDFLSAEDKEKLKEYKEDDNPWLVKYYFN